MFCCSRKPVKIIFWHRKKTISNIYKPVKVSSKGRGCFVGEDQFVFETHLKTVNYVVEFLWYVRNIIKMVHFVFTVFEEFTLCSIEITLKKVIYIYGLMPEMANTVKVP